MDYTIQYGTVVDGTGVARFAADVLIHDGRVAEVAPHVPPVGEVIDARGMSCARVLSTCIHTRNWSFLLSPISP